MAVDPCPDMPTLVEIATILLLCFIASLAVVSSSDPPTHCLSTEEGEYAVDRSVPIQRSGKQKIIEPSTTPYLDQSIDNTWPFSTTHSHNNLDLAAD